jgi:hypothetical protein
MITNIPRMSVPVPTSRPTPRLRPAQAAPVRRGHPAAGEDLPCGGVVRWGDGCAPTNYETCMRMPFGRENCLEYSPYGGRNPFAGGDED